MSTLTLPAAPAVGTHSDLTIGDNHILRLDTMADIFEDGTVLEIQCSLVHVSKCGGFFAYYISGLGSAPADALLAIFGDEDIDGLCIPAEVAAALDELARQAVRIVCNRLSGGTMDGATFAETHLLDTQSGPTEPDGECDQATIDRIEQKFLKLLAEQEPDHPWVCKLRAPREGNHPRSKENVLR